MFRVVLLLMLIPALAPAQQRMARFGDPIDGFSQYSGIPDSQRVVIRDPAAWRQYWTAVNQPFVPAPAVPDVDFAREMILLVSMGTRPSGGFVIRIDSAMTDAQQVRVQVTQIVPGRGCLVPAVVTRPVDLARVPATPLPVSFAERVERTDCLATSAPDRR